VWIPESEEEIYLRDAMVLSEKGDLRRIKGNRLTNRLRLVFQRAESFLDCEAMI
jgi:hypothetical protein